MDATELTALRSTFAELAPCGGQDHYYPEPRLILLTKGTVWHARAIVKDLSE